MDLQQIDLDTIQPNGKRGETQRPAFTKINQNFKEVALAVDAVPEAVARAVSGRNRLINGNFDCWQRGTSFNTSGRYTADRWFLQMQGIADPVFRRNPTAMGDNNFPVASTRCPSARVETPTQRSISSCSSNVWRTCEPSPIPQARCPSWYSMQVREGAGSHWSSRRPSAQRAAPRYWPLHLRFSSSLLA